MRTKNFLGHKNKMPKSFYSGETGILPVDNTIKKIINTAYCHHIERLMILGNFMLLTKINPLFIYEWFMEMFIDAYDWVMVPNVYAMSQFADGGTITTKPYFSSSNYILKMSNYKKGKWCEVWDALFYIFLDEHREIIEKNPRLGVLTRHLDNLSNERMEKMKEIVKNYYNS
jgi:deoxyribodipyrimidine photolyase-related protein